MIVIAALGTDRVIGSGDGMPWSVPEEYAQFLNWIEGQTVLMGRRSWEIFGADLTSAHTIVISRSAKEIPGAEVARSVAAAISRGRELGKTVYCAGGAGIYEQALPHADTMYLSYIKGTFRGDAFFPEFTESEWIVERREDHPRFEFVVHRRARQGRARPKNG